MNKTQKGICLVVIGIIVAMFLFPPMQIHLEGGWHNVGYHFLLDSRKPTVNVALLLAQWVGVLIVGAIAYFIAKGGK